MHAPFTYAEIPTELNPDAEWIADSALDPVWNELDRQDAAMFVFPKARQLSLVADLAERHPTVPIVVDHMAWPDEQTDPDESSWTDFRRVAEHDNT
jgi:L-fuconolactonase